MNIILFDSERINLYPLSLTRPISNFRIGILTIKEKWELYYKTVSVKTEEPKVKPIEPATQKTKVEEVKKEAPDVKAKGEKPTSEKK